MYLHEKGTDRSESRNKLRDDATDRPISPRDEKFEGTFHRPPLNPLSICGDGVDYAASAASEWVSTASNNTGELMSLEDIHGKYNRNLAPTTYHGNAQSLPPIPRYNGAVYNQNNATTNSSDGNALEGYNGFNGGSQVDFAGLNNFGEFGNAYGPATTRLDRPINVSDLVMLTEAINELTRRMPLPPTPELLKAIEPHLAMTLQLTYLHAYIQNQQLLVDIKNRIFGGVLGNCDFMNTLKSSLPTLPAPPPMDGNQYATSPCDYGNIGQMSLDAPTDITCGNSMDYGIGVPQIWYPNQMYAIGASSNNLDPSRSSLHEYENQKSMCSEERRGQYFSFVDAVEALHPPQAKSPTSSITVTPALPSDSVIAIDSFPTNSAVEAQMALSDKITPPKEISRAIPPEIRNMVKYDAQKHSFVSVYLGPLGARRRRLFSIRKFGIEGALKLATDFAVGSISAAVASKERKLLEEVCEVALKCNPRSGQKLDHVEAARGMPETRGLVFSCGAQLWMIITYDSSNGMRKIEAFSVEQFGFDGAYKAAVSALDQKLQNTHIITSKLSGPLYFWLEGPKGGEDLCLMVTPRDLLRQGSSDNDLYIGRFNVAESGGFNAARKRAQKWRSDLRNQLIN